MIASGHGTTQWNQVMTVVLLTIIAPVAIVLVIQRAFVARSGRQQETAHYG